MSLSLIKNIFLKSVGVLQTVMEMSGNITYSPWLPYVLLLFVT